MNQELIKTANNALALSPQTEKALELMSDPISKQIIQAGLGTPIRSINEEVSQDSLIEMIASIYLLAGQTADAMQLPTYAVAFYHRLMQEFPVVTIEEIRLALTNGVYEQYGEYFGLNAKTFIKWVRQYLEDEKRKAAKEEFAKKKKIKDDVPPSPPYWDNDYWTDAQLKIWRNGAEQAYQYFLKGDVMVTATPEAVYWLLRREGLIAMSQERTDALIEQARNICRNKAVINTNRRTALEVEKLINKITSGNDRDTKTLLHLEAKRIAVIEYFAQAQNQGKEKLFEITQNKN